MKADVRKSNCRGVRSFPRPAAFEKRLTINVPEAAEMLGISRNFAYELVKRGDIPVRRFGRRLLIPRILLEKMLGKDA